MDWTRSVFLATLQKTNRVFAIEMEKMFAKDIAESDQIKWEE